MKKLLLTVLLGAFGTYASATIVIRGKVRDTEHGGGTTTISCKGNQGECVRIENKSRTAEVLDENGRVTATYAYDDYRTEKTGSGEEEVNQVVLIGARIR